MWTFAHTKFAAVIIIIIIIIITAVRSLKPERLRSPLVQEKYLEEKACDKRHPYRIIVIVIVIIIIIIMKGL